ncbi:MAG: ribonuclease III [bacterium]|nr:ribonuclease III [bacterium]
MAKRKNRTILPEREKELRSLLKSLNIKTNNIDIFDLALTHKSYANENYTEENEHNERLEFLGDAVLSLGIGYVLYKRFPAKDEGFLTKLRAKIIGRKNLANVCQELNLGDYLLLSKGELKSSKSIRESILSNTLEAFLGALYLDQGFKFIKGFIFNCFIKNIEAIIDNEMFTDYKSKLQEYFMQKFNELPEYLVEKEEGIEHKKTFYINVVFRKKIYGSGNGKNKKEAAQNAAFNALKALGNIQ